MRIKRKAFFGMEHSGVLSDMAFLLIIYFIVIAGFNLNRFFLMELPEKGSLRTVPGDELLRFSIDEQGLLFFSENQIRSDEAADVIRGALEKKPNTALILGIDENAPWQSVVSFVDLARKNKVDSFSFSLQEKANER
jgi:biopolymer transport protein ExbD